MPASKFHNPPRRLSWQTETHQSDSARTGQMRLRRSGDSPSRSASPQPRQDPVGDTFPSHRSHHFITTTSKVFYAPCLSLLPTLPLKEEAQRLGGMCEATCLDAAEETPFEHLESQWRTTKTEWKKSPVSSVSRITTDQISYRQNIPVQSASPSPTRERHPEAIHYSPIQEGWDGRRWPLQR